MSDLPLISYNVFYNTDIVILISEHYISVFFVASMSGILLYGHMVYCYMNVWNTVVFYVCFNVLGY